MAYDTDVTIDGTLITDDILRIKVKKSMSENNASGSFEIQMENTNGRHAGEFSIGDSVVIETTKDAVTTTLITGSISELSFSGKESVKEKLLIKGYDLTRKLQDATVVPAVFKDDDISTIITSIITDNVPGVTTTNVNPNAKVIDSKRFNHTPVFDALRQLARESNSFFYVDSDSDLNFLPKGTLSSDLRFDTNNITKGSFTTIDRELYNNVWVYGARRLTGWQNDFTANGGSVYTLDFKPHNTNVFVGGSTTPKQGGVFEFSVGDVGSPTQYLVDFDLSRVIFVSGTATGDNIPISGTDSFNVKYERDTPIVKFGIDRISQAKYKKKELIIVDKNITDPREAIDRVNSELINQSSPIIEGNIDVNSIVDVTPGQTATVDFPYQGINEQNYEVIEVTYDIDRTKELGNNITSIKLNKRIIKLTDTIKQLALDIKKIQADDATDTDLLTRLETAVGEIGLKREWYIKTRNIGNAFVLGHSVNGVLGSPQIGVNGSQITLGSSSAGTFSIIKSGGQF